MNFSNRTFCLLVIICLTSLTAFSQEGNPKKGGGQPVSDEAEGGSTSRGLRKIASGSAEQMEIDVDIDEQALEADIEVQVEKAMVDVEVVIENLVIDIDPIEVEIPDFDFQMEPIDIEVDYSDINIDQDVDIDMDLDMDMDIDMDIDPDLLGHTFYSDEDENGDSDLNQNEHDVENNVNKNKDKEKDKAKNKLHSESSLTNLTHDFILEASRIEIPLLLKWTFINGRVKCHVKGGAGLDALIHYENTLTVSTTSSGLLLSEYTNDLKESGFVVNGMAGLGVEFPLGSRSFLLEGFYSKSGSLVDSGTYARLGAFKLSFGMFF